MKKRLFCNWVLGVLVGTFLIAITSPLFVRSYSALQIDPVRNVPVHLRGEHYRWRSEGYATTRIGVMGMPGGPMIIPETSSENEMRVALWGDSQAEGVCVADSNKLHRQLERMAQQAGLRLTVFPMARSGDDLNDWLYQIPRVDSKLDIDVQLLLIAELSDLAGPVSGKPSDLDLPANRNSIAKSYPAFLIEAIRRIVRHPDDTPRSLRFGLGPITSIMPPTESIRVGLKSDWKSVAKSIEAATNKQVIIVYAPNIPVGFLVGEGKTEVDHSVLALKNELTASGIGFIDARGPLRRSAAANRWPHGFHNGQFGVGHLNAVGYEVIAKNVVQLFEQSDNRVARIAD